MPRKCPAFYDQTPFRKQLPFDTRTAVWSVQAYLSSRHIVHLGEKSHKKKPWPFQMKAQGATRRIMPLGITILIRQGEWRWYNISDIKELLTVMKHWCRKQEWRVWFPLRDKLGIIQSSHLWEKFTQADQQQNRRKNRRNPRYPYCRAFSLSIEPTGQIRTNDGPSGILQCPWWWNHQERL